MTLEDFPRFAAALTMLAELFPQSKVNLPAVVEAYFDDLRRWPIEYVESLFVRIRRTCKFFPSIAEVLEVAGEWKRREYYCEACQATHGVHVFHRVTHDAAMATCLDCDMVLPRPVPPAPVLAPASLKQLPPPEALSAAEEASFRELMRRVPALVGTQSSDNDATPDSVSNILAQREMTAEAIAARKAYLKSQLASMLT